MKRFALTLLASMLATAASAAADLADGEVRKIDKAAGTVILRHGEIRSLNMGPMTMAFVARPPTLLDNLSIGDKVKFRAEEVKGDYVVTRIEKAK